MVIGALLVVRGRFDVKGMMRTGTGINMVLVGPTRINIIQTVIARIVLLLILQDFLSLRTALLMVDLER